ncbi:MAG: hypothetical protein WCI57_02590 [Candidatus Berkelbacteria bacterium]
MARDDIWLTNKLEEIWTSSFSDVPRENTVKIRFGQFSRRRLGSIKQDSPIDKLSCTRITITGYFKDESIPEHIITSTIAHELCHYAHGFGSPLPKVASHPHRGRLVDRELTRRGFALDIMKQNAWLKSSWQGVVGQSAPRRRRARKPKDPIITFLRKFLIS